MIEIGKYNTLQISQETETGLLLKDNSGEEIVLPTKHCPKNFEIDDTLNVFVYLDYSEKKTATTIKPKIKLYEFALLQVAAITQVGAFLNWGLDKDLLAPFNEQKLEMLEGRWYVVYLDLDENTNRLFASSKIDRQLQNINIIVEKGDKVDIIIYQQTDLGYSVIINNEHKGLIYGNEIFTTINIGDKLTAYVKKVRDDNHIDISLQPIGYRNFNDNNSTLIYKKLVDNNDFLPINDKSSPEEIKNMLGLSKKAFKKSIGALYKDRIITIEEMGIRLVKKA
ncbi:MAG TPA: GntR family transcriptional regulator [Flavobacteriaceae bacterium]|jgi:predicted RNA-binding protein (virulence factor B family)|nr:GntR family transcriptional regulator [Flavobacteriaceae bacterium]HBS12157.1 GntR family transcriptional regulator [Flavobacteriaceae bacterium]